MEFKHFVPVGVSISGELRYDATAPDTRALTTRGPERRPQEDDCRCDNCGSRMPTEVGDWIPVIVGDTLRLACDRQCAVELEK